MKILLWLLALWAVINIVAPFVDDYCVVGRLSLIQAYTLNYETEWDKKHHDAHLGDRVLRSECSEFSRHIFRVLW